jgi:RimJ/RimL family protein N-acetyltransferase
MPRCGSLNGKIIGIAEYTRRGHERSRGRLRVDEPYRRGVGTLLLEHLALAMRNGLTRFVAYVLSDNYDMRRVLPTRGLT